MDDLHGASKFEIERLSKWWGQDQDDHFDELERLVSLLGTGASASLARDLLNEVGPDLCALGIDLALVLYERAEFGAEQVIRAADSVALDDPRDLRWSAVHALSLITEIYAQASLIRFYRDTDNDIRALVSQGRSFATPLLPRKSLAALTELCWDSDELVSGWALYTLAEVSTVDTPHVRELLLQFLDDPRAESRIESTIGLAERQDERVLPVLRKALSSTDVAWRYVHAAGRSRDPSLLPLLVALRNNRWSPDHASMLDEAIDACSER